MFYFENLKLPDKGRRTKVKAKPFFHCQVALHFKKANLTSTNDQFGLTLSDDTKARLSWFLLNIKVPFKLRNASKNAS